jgi:hypothetical protein
MMRYSTVFVLAMLFFSCSDSNTDNKNSITFNEHIAHVIHKNCTPCHRPGESGPFPLITYKDVRKKAKTVVEVTQSGLMPPWPADPTYRDFVGERFLSEQEKTMIKTWVENGSPEGEAALFPEPPHYPEGSMLGKPDLVITMDKTVKIPGNNRDNFLVVKVPYELDKDTFVRAFEFVPGNRKLAHHVNGHLVQYDDDKKSNVFVGPRIVNREEAGTLEACYQFLKLLNDDGSYPTLTPSAFNFLPGMESQLFPEQIGGFVMKKKGAILMRDIHYGPSPINDTDRSYVNVFFAPHPPVRPFMETQLGTLGISDIIPPLVLPPDTVMKFVTRAVIQSDISMVMVNPHMHLLGKSFLSYAITPVGDTIPIVRINEWDFRWQYAYTFKKLLKIPRGSVIVAEGVFDNTVNNPNNPFIPPKLVSGIDGSMKTTDEMFQLILTFLPYEVGDEDISLENVKLEKAGL